MEKFLDAYIKLVTQFLTILAPITTLVLNELNKRKTDALGKQKEFDQIYLDDINNLPPGGGERLEQARKAAEKDKERRDKINGQLVQLSPQKHIPFIFGALSISLVFGMLSFLYFSEQDKARISQNWFWGLFFLSVAFFLLGIYFIIKMMSIIFSTIEDK